MAVHDSYVGIWKRTEKRILLVFRRNPLAPDVAVVADLDSMPEKFAQPIAELIQRKGVDRSKELAFHLSAVRLPNDSYNLLERLHYAGLLFRVPVEEVAVLDVDRRVRVDLTEVFTKAIEIPEEEAKKLGISTSPPTEYGEGEDTTHPVAPAMEGASGPVEENAPPAASDDIRNIRSELDELRGTVGELARNLGEILALLRGTPDAPPDTTRQQT